MGKIMLHCASPWPCVNLADKHWTSRESQVVRSKPEEYGRDHCHQQKQRNQDDGLPVHFMNCYSFGLLTSNVIGGSRQRNMLLLH
jgi:hypothetical protein